MENETKKEGIPENEGNKTAEKSTGKDSWLKIKLKKPVDYQGFHVEELDLTGLKNLNGQDLGSLHNLYSSHGGDNVFMRESTLLFAQLAASRVTGLPLEVIYEISAKDSVTLCGRVYRFFYL